jgi:uncharacterized protein YecT (DUF1311 family)
VAEPQLIVNAYPAVCEPILARVKDLYSSSAPVIHISSAVTAVDWISVSDSSPRFHGVRLRRLDLDLDGTGHKQVLLRVEVPIEGKGTHSHAYVFPSAESFDAAALEQVEWWNLLEEDGTAPETPDLPGARYYYPAAHFADDADFLRLFANPWSDQVLFESAGSYYFVAGPPPLVPYGDGSGEVYRLRADGSVELACKITAFATGGPVEKFKQAPAVRSFLGVLGRMGTGVRDCDMFENSRHDLWALSAQLRATVRPWAIVDGDAKTRADEYLRTEKWMTAWGLEEVWNWREYQTFVVQHLPAAKAGVASYLVAEFGVDPEVAKIRGDEVVRALLMAWLKPPQGDPADGPRNHRQLALLVRSESMLAVALEEARAQGPGHFKQVISESLSDAVEWPYGLERLLREGADPNFPNRFGKTPLMVAAHMNRADSVMRLLQAGANANAVTRGLPGSCGGPPVAAGRTALTYAAENASPVVMKLLFEATGSKGLEGIDINHYLALNPRLDAQERAAGFSSLAGDVESFRNPGFDCKRTRTRVEKMICSSDVLRVFDAEMTRAYQQFRTQDNYAALASQREWLAWRDSRCAIQDAEYENCLAEQTRIRIRYLHRRIAEAHPRACGSDRVAACL